MDQLSVSRMLTSLAWILASARCLCADNSFFSLSQVEKLVLINPSVYAEGTGNLAKLPTAVAYAGVSLQSPLTNMTFLFYSIIYSINELNAYGSGFVTKNIPFTSLCKSISF